MVVLKLNQNITVNLFSENSKG